MYSFSRKCILVNDGDFFIVFSYVMINVRTYGMQISAIRRKGLKKSYRNNNNIIMKQQKESRKKITLSVQVNHYMLRTTYTVSNELIFNTSSKHLCYMIDV